jgi:mannose-6-phosphate isomerase
VQQSCNTTYRLYDWGRPRELHVEKGLQVIKNHTMDTIQQFPGEFDCPYFSLEQIHVSGGYGYFVPKSKIKGSLSSSDIAGSAHILPSMTQLLFIISGNGTIRATYADGTKAEPQQFVKEQLFAVLPGEKIVIEGSAEIMKICAK